MKKRVIAVLLFMLGIVLTISAAEKKMLLVCEEYPPYQYSENGRVVGIHNDIVEEAAKNLGIKVEIILVPWPRALQMVKTGKADGIFSIFKTKEREEYLYFPKWGISKAKNIFITYKGSGIKYSGDFREMKNCTIGILRDNSYGEKFDKADFLIKEDSKTSENLLRKIILKRNKVGIMNYEVAKYHLNKMREEEKIEYLYPFVSEAEIYIAFSKKKKDSKENAENFSKELEKIRESGRYEKIAEKYFKK